jgi:hypothetical protein
MSEFDREISSLIRTGVDALGRPLNTLGQLAPSWLLEAPALKVEVTDTVTSTFATDTEITRQMASDGQSKEYIQSYLEQHSLRMQSLETQEQKDQYFDVIHTGLQQSMAVELAEKRGIDLAPQLSQDLGSSQSLEV